jgi:transglutaminase-like putative cysteine protease
LIVAAGASVSAYLLAYLPGRGQAWVPLLALAFLVPSFWVRAARVPASLVRWLPRALLVLVVVTGMSGVLSRQLFIIAETTGLLVGFVAGGMLCVLVAIFLYSEGHWRVATGLLPALMGVLVAAGLERQGWGFLPLAAVAGAALWTHAVLTGGPRRLGLALVLFLLVGGGLAWGTILFLPWAQPHVMQLVTRGLNEGKTGLSDRSELGEVESLALSKKIVARVWTGRPQLLRMKVFDHFDGRRWSTGSSPLRAVTASPSAGSGESLGLLSDVPGSTFELMAGGLGEPARTQTRVVPSLGFDDGWGPLIPAESAWLRAPTDAVKVDGLGQVFVSRVPETYGVAETGGPDRRPGPSPADARPPQVVGDGVRELARSLGEGAVSSRERAARTVGLLHSPPYRYTLEVGRFRSKDVVAEFLLEKKAGYCEYFATAAVVLLRLQGVPARYVKGVRVRPESEVAGHYVVRESDAHAWVEAWVEGDAGAAGEWVELDPTPPDDYASLHASPRPGPLEERWEALQVQMTAAWTWFRLEGWPRATARIGALARATLSPLRDRPALAAVSAFLAVLLVPAFRMRGGLRRWLSARRPRSRADEGASVVPSELRRLLAQVERLWAHRGSPRPASQGLHEHLANLTPQLTPEELRLSALVVESYYRASFGGQAPTEEQLAQARSALPRP